MDPSFDTWTSLFLIVAGFGVFLFFTMMSNAATRKSSAPIALVVLAFSLILGQYVLYWTGYQNWFPKSFLIPPLCYYSLGPLLYLYFFRWYHNREPRHQFWHFLPSGLVLFLAILQFIPADADGLNQFHAAIRPAYYLIHHWLISFQMSVYAFLLWRMTWNDQSQKSLQLVFIRQKWTRILALLFTIFILAYVSYYILVNFSFFNKTWDYSISLMMSVSIYSIGFFAFREPAIFNGELLAGLFSGASGESAPKNDRLLSGFYQKLLEHLEQEKPYLDCDLRLVHLADQLGFSVHLLSQVINEESGKNFNQLVNDYRLAEAEELLLLAPHLSIKTIYFQSGFANKATFYQAFKKKYNCTPSEFRQRQWRTHIERK